MISMGKYILTKILGLSESDKIWKPLEGLIDEQVKKSYSLRELAKEIFESG